MATREVTVCDGCRRVLERTQDIYRLVLRTNRFLNSVEMDYLEERLEFCQGCAVNIKESLAKIAAQNTGRPRQSDQGPWLPD